MKKRLISLLLASLFLLSACSENQTESSNITTTPSPESTAAPAETTTEATTTAAPVTEPVEVTFYEPPLDSIKPAITFNVVFEENFESGASDFKPRGGETVEVTAGGYNSDFVLKTYNRTATWNGPQIDLTASLQPSTTYDVTAMVKYEGAAATKRIDCKIQQNDSTYLDCGVVTAKSGEWTELKGSIEIPAKFTSCSLYFESEYKENAQTDDLVEIYVDNIVVKSSHVEELSYEIPVLHTRHDDSFKVGVAVTAADLRSLEISPLVKKHFNSITMGNEMKPDSVLDYVKCSNDPEKYNLEPAIKEDNLKIGLKFAKENGLLLRGHTLVWHSQTPAWFFKENYSKDANAPNVSREVMLARMESYIKQVLEYCQTNYPGVVYAYDVVNEAIDPADAEPNGIRTKNNLWYDVVGADYPEMAFTFARKYASPEIKLFYNDFNCHDTTKRFRIYELLTRLKEQGLVDGMGLQSHYGLAEPTTITVMDTITKFAELDLEIQITELDINTTDNSDEGLEKLAVRYKKLINLYRQLNDNGKANITSVTVWGFSDKGSWLNDTEKKYPLLFDDYLQPKLAFWGFYLHSEIPSY